MLLRTYELVSPLQYRPITCMSTLYKLTTRCITEVVKREVEARGLLTENQMGTKRRIQGAKEHALTSIVLNVKHKHKLYATWVDVKKAYDSVDHKYLMHVLESLKLPDWVLAFLRASISRWHIDIRWGKEALMTKAIGKGILQGDSLSPLLFVLCMDPLSRKLNALYPPVKVRTPDDRILATNHLLYIDDLKIIVEKKGTLKAMTEETQKFLKAIGFEMNREKSATNSPEYSDAAKLLEGTGTYKYLGITEDGNSRTSAAMLEEIIRVIVKRVQTLTKTDLSAKNLFRAINRYTLTVINYFIGVVPTEKDDMARIDRLVRKHLREAGVIKDNSNVSRLYLPRKEMGRGLHNLQHKAEAMMLRLWLTLSGDESRSPRRAAICQYFRSSYHRELKDDYGIEIKPEESIERAIRDLRYAQTKNLHDVINETKIHKLLFSLRGQRNIDFEGSTLWMRKSMLNPQEEAKLVNLQDRNLAWMSLTGTHRGCGRVINVDHLATKCEKLVHVEYTRRHDEVARRLHFVLARQIGVPNLKHLDKHKVEARLFGRNGWITFNKEVKTDKAVTHNKPDIILAEEKKNRITVVEVGVTCQDNLEQVEIEKKHKYEPLTKQMEHHKWNKNTEIRLIPYVMTWDW
ncbi:putative reverse transcriptase, partial [Babesia divergens]